MNANGNAKTLTPAEPGNTLAARHAVYSPRLREPRAREIAEAIMEGAHTVPLDLLAALEVGRLVALIESLDVALGEGGPVNPTTAKARAVVDLRLRASRRLL